MKKFIIIAFIIFLENTCCFAQVFSKFYDYNGINDLSSQLIYLPNNTYITLSASVDLTKTDTFNYAKTHWFFVKANFQGDTIKTKVYSKKHFYLGTSGATTILFQNNKNIHVGEVFDLVRYKNDSIGSDIHIVLFDDNLDTLKTKIIRYGLGNESTTDVLKSSDGNIVIFGQNCTQGLPIKDCNYFLMKLDTNLNVIWQNSYGYDPIYWENPAGFVETEDKGFLLFGYTNAYIFGQKRYWYLVKTDSLGNKQWQKTYFKNDIQVGRGITKTKDGNYLLTGSVETIITGGVKEFQGWLMKIDPQGNTIWEKIYGSERFDFFIKALENHDTSIIIMGYQTSERLTVNDADAWLLKFDKNGNKLWERIYNNYSAIRHQHPDDVVYSMRLTEDKGVVMVGWSRNPELQNPTQDIWLLKVDSFGCLIPGCQGVGIDGKRISTEEVLIYPNPAKESIKLKHRETINYYRILDITGKVIQEGNYTTNGIQLSPNLSSGNYLIHVQFESGTQGFGKLVKE